MAAAETGAARAPRARASSVGVLAVGALGVVYGDIGTSPLYALQTSVDGVAHDVTVSEANVLGLLSLVFWSLVIVISVKYIAVVMRATNNGEGGILALTALLLPGGGSDRAAALHASGGLLILVGVFGTALLYGDGMITPAVSVLSAVEGTEIATPAFDDLVVPIAVGILVVLFAVQHRGTGAIGRVFGPIMIVWFVVIGLLGAIEVVQSPSVLRAVNPAYGWRFFFENGGTGFLALGSIVLVVTGGEALYADLGAFGRRPIASAWFAVVLPALLLNYFGQGALLLSDPGTIENPFFRLAPTWGIWPLVILATMATVIASEALITGAFSLTSQAAQLGFTPRLRILHTSSERISQVYVPIVNWLLMVACIGLVLGFRSSTNLSAAYGLAVTMTMVITTILFFVVARRRLGWSLPLTAAVCGALGAVDVAFLGANVLKIPHGGWFPLAVGIGIFVVLTTWHTGHRLVVERIRQTRVPLDSFVEAIPDDRVRRVPHAAVYLHSAAAITPQALLTRYLDAGVLHERIYVAHVVTADVPSVPRANQVTCRALGHGIDHVAIEFGYRDRPDIPGALATLDEFDPEHTKYFLSKTTVLVTGRSTLARWRSQLYAFLDRNASGLVDYYNLPPDRVVEVGTHVEL